MLGMMQLHQKWQIPGGCDSLAIQYANATSLLNLALSSPLESRDDGTLLATFLLSVIEMKSSPDFSLRYWLVHVKGAAALMELRGADQVLSRLGAALYLQLSSQVMIYCILGNLHVPEELHKLRYAIGSHVVDQGHPLWQWHGLIYRFTDFYANATALESRSWLRTDEARAIINKALNIYGDMQDIFQAGGSYWKYDTQSSEEFSPLVSYEHVYYSLLAVRVWNDRRTVTITLFATILRAAARSQEQLDLYNGLNMCSHNPLGVIRETALEILAAVPQMLAGLKGKALPIASRSLTMQGLRLCDSNSEYDEQVFQQARQNSTLLPYMDSCRVQWSLYFAVKCEFVERKIRLQLLHVLRNAGDIMQIQQWRILAERVQQSGGYDLQDVV